jgi:5-methylcytosine-specific restriction protein A
MAAEDWYDVYKSERRRPTYIIEDGRSIVKRTEDPSPKHQAKIHIHKKEVNGVSPFAPKHPCSYPGCAILTNASRCDHHKKQEQQEYDRLRGHPASRGYNYAWRKASREYLARNPLCAKCLERNRVVAATVTDHIIPHKGDPGLFWDPGNWQALCKPCHDSKTARHDGRWG